MTGQARWRDWLALGLGHLQIQPDQFWRMTPAEFFAAADGYLQRMGAQPEDEPLTKAEVREMFAEYEKRQLEKSQNVH